MLVVCPNLALDRTLVLDRLDRGGVSRARSVTSVAGGKGVNAARVGMALGASPRLVGFAGGANGEVLKRRLELDEIPCELVPTAGETRLTVALLEADGVVSLVNEPGPEVTAAECRCLVEAALAAVRPGEPVLLTGSLPPGAPPALYAELVEVLSTHEVVVDAGGRALAASLAAGPYLVKPNREEAAAWGDRPAEALVAAGARNALVTDGPRETVLAGDGETLRLVPPGIDVVNTLGCGDALAGALLAARERGEPLREALLFGVAAAADNALQSTAGRVDAKRVLSLAASLGHAGRVAS